MKILKWLFIIFSAIISISIQQETVDQLKGNILQIGEIIIKNIQPGDQIEYNLQQNIKDTDYNVVLSLKRVSFSKKCDSQFEFRMDIKDKQINKFIIEISKFKCMEEVEIMWFLHTYQEQNNTVSYFKEQKYEKNFAFKNYKKIQQTYFFDADEKNRKVLSLFTGFILPFHVSIKQLVTKARSNQGWQNQIEYNTEFELQQLFTTPNNEDMKLSVTINFIIVHPDILSCTNEVDQAVNINKNNTLALQNIQYLQTTQASTEGKFKICNFQQYQPDKDGHLASSFKPIISPKKIYTKKDGLIDYNEQADDKDYENIANDTTEKNKSQNSNDSDNVDKYIQIFGLVFIVFLILATVLYLLLRKKAESQQQEQHVGHVEMADDL